MVSSAQNNWGLSVSASTSGGFNMAMDDYTALQNNNKSILRLYGWSPSAVSIGFHQSSDILNKSACLRKGVGIIRRPTGGRAILHSEELTYSIVIRGTQISLSDAYKKVHSALAAGLSKLGVNSKLVETSIRRTNLSPKSDKVSCFSASARTELEFNGRKIVGSAGRKYENSILIHGSILLGDKHKEIVDLLNLSEKGKRVMKKELDYKTADISTIVGRIVEPEELIKPICDSFSDEFQAAFDEHKFTDEDLRVIEGQKDKFVLLNLVERAVA